MIKKLFTPKKTLKDRLTSNTTSFTLDLPWTTFTGIREGEHLITTQEQAPLPGQTFRHIDDRHSSIVVSSGPAPEEENIVISTTQLMPHFVSVVQVFTGGVSLAGKVLYKLRATNWNSLPAQINNLRFKLPKAYQPDRGDLITHNGEYYQIISTAIDGPFCVCVTEKFDI